MLQAIAPIGQVSVFDCLDLQGPIRGHFLGVIRGTRGETILEEALLGGLLGHIKAKILVMPASSGPYS